MRRFGRKGRRRSQVRWLPDKSAFSQLHAHTVDMAQSNSWEWNGFEELGWQANEAADVPTQLQTNVPTGGVPLNRWREASSVNTLILDHIKGKVSWCLDAQGPGELSDMSGRVQLVLRFGIYIAERAVIDLASQYAGTIPSGATGGGLTWGYDSNMLDPGSAMPGTLFGSELPDGFRILWRRNFYITALMNEGVVVSTPESAEDCCPPGPYVDIKPKRILRPNEGLCFGWAHNVIPGEGCTGGFRVMYAQDLRTAAHNTARRR